MLRGLLASPSPAQPRVLRSDTASSQTLLAVLRQRALRESDRLALAFIKPDAAPAIEVSYAEVDRRARVLAATMQKFRGVEQCVGARAVLIFQPDLDFTIGFLGCIYAGVMAAPVYAPHPAQFKRFTERLTNILNDAEPAFILTTSSYLLALRNMLDALPAQRLVKIIALDELAGGIDSEWSEPEIDSNSIAFLQYTSGSTSAPKAVMVSHGNLTHNLAAISRVAADIDAPQGVSWLPPYHDMGLIGGILQPLFAGFPCAIISPMDFLMRPALWLETMSRLRGTVSPLPNFALDLCVRKISDDARKDLNLSSWRVAINGAEPIRKEWLDRFTEKFAVCGFSPEVHRPVYGLAEATLMVSCKIERTPARSVEVMQAEINLGRVEPAAGAPVATRTLVSCGKSIRDQTIAIVNPQSMNRCMPDEVGEIWLQGPSVAQGYWNKPDDTARTFNAYILSTGEGPFLRTGDLGFLDGDELFITGRCKELIVIEGKNYYPHDIEIAVEQIPLSVRMSSCAAFSISDNESERMVLVIEADIRRSSKKLDGDEQTHLHVDVQEIVRQVRQGVCASVGIDAYDVRLIKRGTMPKTSSGKVQRFRCRDAYVRGTLEQLA